LIYTLVKNLPSLLTFALLASQNNNNNLENTRWRLDLVILIVEAAEVCMV